MTMQLLNLLRNPVNQKNYTPLGQVHRKRPWPLPLNAQWLWSPVLFCSAVCFGLQLPLDHVMLCYDRLHKILDGPGVNKRIPFLRIIFRLFELQYQTIKCRPQIDMTWFTIEHITESLFHRPLHQRPRDSWGRAPWKTNPPPNSACCQP